ncbi:hypothetical protein [Deinococcus arenicola]|uniref:Phosphotyrosine protein phosphatase n=1 Tax=Deinococcus arenicola TaxID=2994950 RepID=A0ABU4DUQ4_9DEIO|nr:hypothetical protein [Deinococcus sp. ZS9-10]MDV6375809.1 hypothetical protein [Deinococcus sp. ZS9-10]
MPRWQVASAGINRDAETLVSRDLLEWADVAVCMEKKHQDVLRPQFRGALPDDRILTLDIPDDYEFMGPELVNLLRRMVLGQLDRIRPRDSTQAASGDPAA